LHENLEGNYHSK